MKKIKEEILDLHLGHLLDLQMGDRNNYFAAYNCGGRIHRVLSYSHLRKDESEINIVEPKMGNFCKVIEGSNCCVLRDSNDGKFYLYDFITLIKSPTKFSRVDFIDGMIKITDVVSDRVRELNVVLHSCINPDGSFLTPIFNETEDEYYDIADLLEYNTLKNNIRERLINKPSDQEIVKQLLLKKQGRN